MAVQVLTAVEDFAKVRESLRTTGLPVADDQSGLVFVPLMEKQVGEGTPERAFADVFGASLTDELGFHCASQVAEEVQEECEALLERLLAVDDVDAVHTNCAGLAA